MDLPGLWYGGAVALVFIVIFSLSTKTSKAQPGGQGQRPPLVNGNSLLALVPTLLKKDLPAVFNDLYLKYGSVFTLSCFGMKVTFLVGPEVTAHFFLGPESEISHGSLFEYTVPMFGEAVGFCRDKEIQNQQSRFQFEALRPSRLASHVSQMLQVVEGYFAKWGNEGTVDLKVEFQQLLMLISARCLIGKEVWGDMFEEFNKLYLEIENAASFISVLYPYLPTPAHRRRDRARIRLTKILSELIMSRKSSGRVEDDTLQKFIDSKYKDGSSTTVEEVVGLTISLIFAGKQGSTHASTWTGACLLSSDPTFLRAAVEEQQQIAEKYKDGLDYNAFMEMDTLHNCIKEALRMHPPAAMLVRKAHKDFNVTTREGKQYEIPQDQLVVNPIILGNNIPYIYKDPQLYDPFRFGPERKEDKVGGKLSYSSFGAGRHGCIGQNYAYLQMKVIWSHLLRNFQLELVSPFPKTNWSNFVVEPNGNLFVRYKRIEFPQSLT